MLTYSFEDCKNLLRKRFIFVSKFGGNVNIKYFLFVMVVISVSV